MRNRAPFLAGSFAMWGGCFSSVDCMMIWLRQKDDPFNAIIAGGITGGVLAIRAGANAAFWQAMVGAGILALIEGVSILFQSISLRRQHMQMEEMQKQQLEEMKRAQSKKDEDPWDMKWDEKEASGKKGSKDGKGLSSFSF